MRHICTTLFLLTFTLSIFAQKNSNTTTDATKALALSRNFCISIESMNPMSFTSRTVSYGYTLSLSGDTVTMYLPYMGEVYQPEFTNDGLDMTRPIYDYKANTGKKGRIEIKFSCRRDVVEYRFHITIYPEGTAYIDLQPSNAQHISYTGQLDTDN